MVFGRSEVLKKFMVRRVPSRFTKVPVYCVIVLMFPPVLVYEWVEILFFNLEECDDEFCDVSTKTKCFETISHLFGIVNITY